MATAYKKLGHMKKAMELVEGEWKVLNIKSENAKYHSFQYSVVAARLYALEGRYYESMHELERLITLGPNDPREMVHPAYDEMRAEPEFTRLLELQRQRMNTERAKLGLTALSPDDMSRLATLNQTP